MSKQVFSMDFYGKNLSVEIGELAKQANGSVLVRYNDTVILSTVVAVSYTHLDVYKRQWI